MRVQFTNDEIKTINERREENKTSQDLLLPVELQGKTITLGIEVKDVHLLNTFLDQLLKNPEIEEQIGGKLVHLDYREPYNTANILFLQTWINNYINGMVYGPTPDEPVAPVEENVPEEQVDNVESEESDSTAK